MKIITLHYAGGNAYSYRFMEEYFLEHEFINLELPGRGRRTREEKLNDSTAAVEDMFNQLNERLGGGEEYVIYGHSMGALLAFGVSSKMTQIGAPPRRLVVSGSAGPGVGEKKGVFNYPDKEFQEELAQLGGMHEDLLNNEEIMSFFTPILKADFQIAEEFKSEEYMPLKAPIHAIMGDAEVNAASIDNWKEYTTGHFEKSVLTGNHFFIHDHPKELAKIILRAC